jgi:peptidoglycan/xylan/chitin deacetylase (PgdA/CDA1 family)
MSAFSSISVDLDGLAHYCRIFGLDDSALDERARRLVPDVAVPRFLELFDRIGVPATFFAIGAEADPVLKKAHDAGVEIASHGFAHDYAMSRWEPARISEDLDAAHQALTRASGAEPEGFRAPGYTMTPALLRAVAARGYAYDSSTFPAAPYYLLKASVMGTLAMLGRPSRAVLDSPRVLAAPVRPYRPSLDNPYARGTAPLSELPIAVTPVARVPFYGTFVTMAPWLLVQAAWRTLRGFVAFELHAVDVLDTSDGIPDALAARQRDLAVSATEKLSRLSKVFGWMKETSTCVTMREAARRIDLD